VKTVNQLEPLPARHFLRLEVSDRPGVFAQIAALFAETGISMESVVQRRLHDSAAEIAIVTHEVSATVLNRVVASLNELTDFRCLHSVFPVMKEEADQL